VSAAPTGGSLPAWVVLIVVSLRCMAVLFLGLPDPIAWLRTATKWPPFSSSA
jgi:hypothetical protein